VAKADAVRGARQREEQRLQALAAQQRADAAQARARELERRAAERRRDRTARGLDPEGASSDEEEGFRRRAALPRPGAALASPDPKEAGFADERDLMTQASSQESTKQLGHSSSGGAHRANNAGGGYGGGGQGGGSGGGDDDDETADPEAVPFGVPRGSGGGAGGDESSLLPAWARGPVAEAFFGNGGFSHVDHHQHGGQPQPPLPEPGVPGKWAEGAKRAEEQGALAFWGERAPGPSHHGGHLRQEEEEEPPPPKQKGVLSASEVHAPATAWHDDLACHARTHVTFLKTCFFFFDVCVRVRLTLVLVLVSPRFAWPCVCRFLSSLLPRIRRRARAWAWPT
jgi:hypothetical protein